MKLKDLNVIISLNYRIIKDGSIEKHIDFTYDEEKEIFDTYGEYEVICISAGLMYIDYDDCTEPTLEIYLEENK